MATISATLVATGLDEPVFATAPPGDTGQLFIVERGGTIKILDLATGAVSVFLDISDQVTTIGEGGLLGLAFDPDYANNGYFYVDLTNTSDDTEVRRYQVSAGNPNVADPSSMIPIISVDQPDGRTNHKAGWIAFGPDGKLYVALGDGGGFGDPDDNAQNGATLLGKMLRLDVHGDDFPTDPTRNYAIPSDNPFINAAGVLPEIYAFGLRNPFRNSFDRVTGQLYIADVGQDGFEEIDLGQPGANYGWDVFEGPVPFEAGPLGPGTLTDPIYSYDHTVGSAVIGGYVYRGPDAALQGKYFFADEVSGKVFTLEQQGTTWVSTDQTAEIATDFGAIENPTSFAEDAQGNLYIIDFDGEVFRLSAATGGRWVFSVDTTSGFSGLVLGINNGVAPVFPTPQVGKFNVEVFTNTTVAGQPGIPTPDPGFQSSITDPNGTIGNDGLLTGTDLRLLNGDFLAVDSVTGSALQSGSKITLGIGKQTVVGARFDTLVGGSGSQILSALLDNETVIGGTGNASIWGGTNDSIVAGIGANQQIVVTGAGTTIVAGMGGNATIAAAAFDTITALPGGTQNVGIAAGANNLIDLTGNGGVDFVIGSNGDTITAGDFQTNIEGAAGGMLVMLGRPSIRGLGGGVTNLSGSTGSLSNTVLGGVGGHGIGGGAFLDFNPSSVAGRGDLIDLSGSSVSAIINAFAFGTTRVTSPDTILGSNYADSVFGGDGDRIGTGNGSVVGGIHQWTHSDTVAGSAVGFGSNDPMSSTTYDTVAGTATRGTVAGTSSAQVTVGSFNTITDFLFYQGESATTNSAIVATSQATTVGGTASTTVTLPDGTAMTLIGVAQPDLNAALMAGTLFKP